MIPINHDTPQHSQQNKKYNDFGASDHPIIQNCFLASFSIFNLHALWQFSILVALEPHHDVYIN